MVFPVIGGDGKPTGYEIENSLRFNANDERLERTPSSTGSRRKFTLSTWVKFNSGARRNIMAWRTDSNNAGEIRVENTGQVQVFEFQGGSQSNGFGFYSTRLLRDSSAWYNLFISVDTEQGTSGLIMYINGQEITYHTRTLGGGTNLDCNFNLSGTPMKIGSDRDNSQVWDGYMSEMHWIDGTIKLPTDFSETNENGVWIPKKYNGSYGTNGFYMEFKQSGTGTNASGMGADTSGNDNHFAVTNLTATDVIVDTPTNNFCTVNPLGGTNSSGKWTFSEGNTQIQQNNNGSWRATGSTMAVANGKWYWEIEFDAGTMTEIFVGVHDSEVSLEGTNRWVTGSTLFYNHNGGEIRQDGTDTTNDYGVLTAGDILGIALNMDDNQITFYDNGSAIASNFGLSSSITGFAMPTFLSDSSDIVYKVNFGNAPFAISSGNADANGYGNFEYAVPSGYYSLCTKNLAQYG